MNKPLHIIDSSQFSQDSLEREWFPWIGHMAQNMPGGTINALPGLRMASIFYEPSTQTRSAAESAMWVLGGQVAFSSENARHSTGAARGETLADTIRVMNKRGYHVIVLRYHEPGGAEAASKVSNLPIINAGEMFKDHPTQALTDAFTVQQHFGGINGLTMAIVGELKRERSARAFAKIVSNYKVRLFLVSSEAAKMGRDVKEILNKRGITFKETDSLQAVADKVDVIHTSMLSEKREGILRQHGRGGQRNAVDLEILDLLKRDAIIIDPFPRLDEIAKEVDNDPRALYFRQAENALYVWGAVLHRVLK